MAMMVEYSFKGLVYQNVDGLVDGAFGNNILDPSLIHVHGPAVLENSSRYVEVLGAVHLVGTVKKEIARLVSHGCEKVKWETVRGTNWTGKESCTELLHSILR